MPQPPRSSWLVRTIFASLALAAAIAPAAGQATAQEVAELKINSEQYILIDSETGEVYAQRGADEQVAIASLTKIFTAIVAIETAPLDTILTTSEDDLLDPGNNSLMGFEPGERLTLEELLYGLMLPSGNDAALTIARELGYREGDTSAQQSVDRFVETINQRVRDMGLRDTNLVNPHGWGVPGHYSTARDIAAFTRYALEFPTFVDLISAPQYVTAAGFTIYNNNRLLNQYGDLLGGKTGYDWDAGWCLMEVAQRSGMTMISVTLDGIHEGGDWYDDNRVLLEYGFEQKADRLETTERWQGDVARFSDPDAALLSRTATGSGLIAGMTDASLTVDPAVATGAGEPERAALPEAPGQAIEGTTTGTTSSSASGFSLDSTAEWMIAVAGVVLTALLGAIGFLVFASRGGPRPRRTNVLR